LNTEDARRLKTQGDPDTDDSDLRAFDQYRRHPIKKLRIAVITAAAVVFIVYFAFSGLVTV